MVANGSQRVTIAAELPLSKHENEVSRCRRTERRPAVELIGQAEAIKYRKPGTQRVRFRISGCVREGGCARSKREDGSAACYEMPSRRLVE